MEVEGLKFLLNWCKEIDLSVACVTTDRSLSFQKLCRELGVNHKFDGWHLVKATGNKLRTVYLNFQSTPYFKNLGVEIERLPNITEKCSSH